MRYLSDEPSELSISKRCKLLTITRSRVYYKSRPESEEAKYIRHKVYEIWHDSRSVKGSRVITHELREYYKLTVNRKCIQNTMRYLGIKGILPKRNLSKPGELKYKHPYLLSGMNIYRSNQVWQTDLSYVKLPGGMMYVICLIDVFSRYIVGYVITNTLDTTGCIECFNKAISNHHKPQILNSDQGSNFTSHDWVSLLQQHSILISMDAKGRWADNIYIERFWRTLKYECIYAAGIETVSQLHMEVNEYIEYYNNSRLHSALGYKTPWSIYQSNLSSNAIIYCEYPLVAARAIQFKPRVLPTVANATNSVYVDHLNDQSKMIEYDSC
jgi:putative transposase